MSAIPEEKKTNVGEQVVGKGKANALPSTSLQGQEDEVEDLKPSVLGTKE